jgi:hypothetical protein
VGKAGALTLPPGFVLSPRITPIVVTPDYYIGLEREAGLIWAHCDIFTRWTPRLVREVRSARDAIMRQHGGPIFTTSHLPRDGDHDKFRKFVTLMGFTFHQFAHVDGVDHAVYVRWS